MKKEFWCLHILKTAQTSLKVMKPSIQNCSLVGRNWPCCWEPLPYSSLRGKEAGSHLGGYVVRNICVTSQQSLSFSKPFFYSLGQEVPFCFKASEGSIPGTTWTHTKKWFLWRIRHKDCCLHSTQGSICCKLAIDALEEKQRCSVSSLNSQPQAALRPRVPSWFWCWCRRQPSLSSSIRTLWRGMPTMLYDTDSAPARPARAGWGSSCKRLALGNGQWGVLRGGSSKSLSERLIGISDPVWLQLSPDLQLVSTPTPALGQGTNSTGCRVDRSQDSGAPQVPSLLRVPVACQSEIWVIYLLKGMNNGRFHFRLNRIFNPWN